MLAVVETGGKQYVVRPGDRVLVEKLPAAAGAEVVLDKVLLVADDAGAVRIGAPHVLGASAAARCEAQFRTKKLRVVKFKRKVRYRRVHGHRQEMTALRILSIAV